MLTRWLFCTSRQWRETIISFASWLAFLGTVIVMQLPPGSDNMLVLARGIGQGRQVALFTVAGMTLGAGLVQLPFLALGIAALLSAFPLAFALLQWAGAGYLMWLGLQLAIARQPDDDVPKDPMLSPFAAAREGMIATLLNPWPLTFMVAFLPQFVDRQEGHPALQMVVLGLTQKVSGALVLGTYALAASSVGKWLHQHPWAQEWSRRVAGLSICIVALIVVWKGS
jgi:threonine/homoserine/homoserine lactone efflux protein